MVILLHLIVLRFGWIGVEIFFSLSGFLITRILLAQKDLPLGQYLRNFYIRRALRIFPIYFALLIIFTIIFVVSKSPRYLENELVYLYTYTWNWGQIFTRFKESEYFTHAWSLCVEEQFYLLWPLVVYFTPRRYLPKLLIGILLMAPVLRFAIGQYLTYAERLPEITQWVYLGTPFQLDAFAAGAAITVFDFPSKIKRPGLWAVGMVVITLLVGLGVEYLTTGKWRLLTFGLPTPRRAFQSGYQYIWEYSLINLMSASLIIYALHGATAARTLGNRVFKAIGKVSYGMYLYHFPLLAAFVWQKGMTLSYDQYSPIGIAIAIGFIAVTYVISWVSYRFFEEKILALKDRWAPNIPAAAVQTVSPINGG
jgi:peptidoglycan/LPS O-acetylase OafA/YrhL